LGTLSEFVFLAPADAVERWSDALLEAGALAVQAEDADADSPDETALYGEPGMAAVQAGWQRTRLAVLVGAGASADRILALASGAVGIAVPAIVETREIADQDWVSASQAQFEPVPIGTRLVVAPSWHPAEAGDDRIRIELDPGMAFGTGSHPTTRLCLQWLCNAQLAGKSLIDYGCGSGILAIAAAKLGASPVVGVDIDPQAIASAAANARANRVGIELRSTAEAAPAPADIVVANILSNPLKVLAPLLTALARPGARLVLAGLLERQVDEVASAYPQFAMRVDASLDGWACLTGVKR
jgi:ribosomal protein L11 methyltransferase